MSPSIRTNLQFHLTSIEHSNGSAYPAELGEYSDLKRVHQIEINSSTVLDKCVDANGNPIMYPALPHRNYLVACLTIDTVERIFFVYSLQQMKDLQIGKERSLYKELKWRILEISQELNDELRTTVSKLMKPATKLIDPSDILYSRL